MYFNIGILFVLFAFPYCCLSEKQCKFNVDFQQTLMNNGFHRNISYTISFHDDYGIWLNKNCVIALEQFLPPGIYTNPNELADLRRLNRANIFPNKRVNVEAMAEDSEASVMYVIGKVLENKVKLFLPLHARYHAARAGGGIVTNNLHLPSLYLRCPDNRLHDCEEALPSAASVLCFDKPNKECDWKQITYVSLSSAFSWDVPVGDTDSLVTISIGTGIAVVAGTCFLLDALIMYNSRAKVHGD